MAKSLQLKRVLAVELGHERGEQGKVTLGLHTLFLFFTAALNFEISEYQELDEGFDHARVGHHEAVSASLKILLIHVR